EIIEKIKPEFDKVIQFFEGELQKLRTSRASPSLVEDIEVNCFGSKFPLKQLGAISCPQSNQIVIQPWDKSYIEPIEKAIAQSGLGMSATVDKNIIRLGLPLLTEEYRQILVKNLNEKAEQARRTIRHWREVAWENLQESFKEKKITEDEKFRGKDELQKLVDKQNEKIKELSEKKKRELS
ncbi:ribosome recycling factor, partial [Patescibacteria group bacterium]|nr:ribosome recycling factor [Patescibacteria group bacterium]